ncbi:MAG: PBECR2 nuclease fold domain-containing protein [Nitrospinales bacterium]
MSFDGNKKEYRFTDRECQEFVHTFVVDIELLLEYFKENSHLSPFIPFIAEVAEDPYEIWQMFQKNEASGRVRLRYYFVKVLELEEGPHGFVLIFEALDGENKSVEFQLFDGDDCSDRLNSYRAGKLIYVQDD